MRILFAEDEPTICSVVTRGLSEAGYAVDAFGDGESALLAASTVPYDLLVLDVNLPRFNGFEVCRRLRERQGIGPPILFLTARDSIEDRVNGLDSGAEDYMVKPFAFAELLARVRALLRRGSGAPADLCVGELVLRPASRQVTHRNFSITLTAKEFALLEYLMRNAGNVVTREMITDHVWNFELEGESNFIEVFIYSLRQKVDHPFGTRLIQTVRGAGYRIVTDTPG